MCVPLAAAGLAASLIGTGVAAYGSIQQGQAQQSAAKYQASVDQNNATIASYNAATAEASQSQQTQQIERQGTLRLGAQRAALGASGVDVGSGSALDVQSATVQNTAMAANTSQYQGALTAYGYGTQQQNFLDQAQMSTAAGANEASAGDIGAGSTLLGGAGQVASRWSMLNQGSMGYGYDPTGMGMYMGGMY